MRLTLEIDDDVLAAAHALGTRDGMTTGAALSELARRGLSAVGTFPVFGGVPGHRISDELISAHRDD